jgi:cobalt-zinc-cadmium efflux system membrane fusion protein
MKRLMTLIAALLLVAAGYGAAVWRQAARTSDPVAAAPAAPPPPADSVRFDVGASQLASIRVEPVVVGRVPLSEPLSARLAYDENRTARVAAPIAGRVTALRVQPGDGVKAGDALLSLDSPELAQAVADLQKAQSDETRKKLALARATSLVQAGVAPRKDLENAQGDFDAARAESVRAQRRLRNLSPRGGEGGSFVLRAPIAGVITERRVNPGSEIRPDLPDPLFVITDPTRLWALVDLPERDLSKVFVGAKAVVEVDAYPHERFEATVERIGETVDPLTRRVQVRAAITDNARRRLKPEMYARVVLVDGNGATSVRIPNSAIVTQGLYSFVFVETEAGLFKRRRISLSLQDREFTYVTAGLAPGERLVTTGALLLNSELATTTVK